MKNIILRVAAVITIMVLALSVNVFETAYGSAVKESLTVEEALNRALSNSTQYKNYQESERDTQKSISDITSKIGGNLFDSTYLDLYNQLQLLYGKQSVNKLSMELYAAKLEISIIKAIGTVISAENALELYDKTLDYERKQLYATKVKSTYNLVSENAYTTALNNLEKKEKDRVNKVASVDNAYTSLNNMIYANTKSRYNFYLNYDYEQTTSFNLIGAISMAKEKSPELKGKQNDIDTADRMLEQYFEDPDKTQEENELQLMTLENNRVLAALAYNDTVRSIEQKVEQGYNDLVRNETQYESSLMDYEQTLKQHEINEAKFDMGNLTELELINSRNQLEQAEENLRALALDHAVLKKQLANPVLLVN